MRADPLLAEELNAFHGRFDCNGGSATLLISASGSSRQSSNDHVITVSEGGRELKRVNVRKAVLHLAERISGFTAYARGHGGRASNLDKAMEAHPPWPIELPDTPWHPEPPAPPWLPELPAPPRLPELFDLPWSLELPDLLWLPV